MRASWLVRGAGICGLLAILSLAVLLLTKLPDATASRDLFQGTTNDPQVRSVIDLHDVYAHPRQLAYDAKRNGLWFWTSTQDRSITTRAVYDNRVYFYDITAGQLRSWPIYSGDWSSQILAGLALAPNGDVWIGWNRNLVRLHPADGSWALYTLPEQLRYPLPAAVVGDLPTNLGVSDLAVTPDGIVWLARDGALSLTSFVPATGAFVEHPLPANASDPAKLTVGRDGHIFFSTNLSAAHPGHMAELVGEYDPSSQAARIYSQSAEAVALNAQDDLYTALIGRSQSGAGLSLVRAQERADAAAQHRAAAFEHAVLPFAVDDRALAVDPRGRVWMAVAGEPKIAVLDPTSGQVRTFQYAAASIAAHPARFSGTPQPGAVWLQHITAMAADSTGHLWYIRDGADIVEEVAA